MAPFPQSRGAVGRVVTTLACIAVVAGTMVPAAACGTPASTAQAQAPTDTPSLVDTNTPDPNVSGNAGRAVVPTPPTVTLPAEGTVSWAFLDRLTGARYQSANATETSYTESMVKAWLAADALSRADAGGYSPDLDLLEPMILDSDDDAAETAWLDNGADASIYRMIETCGLVDTQVYEGWWSMTLMSARDAVALGDCIADGTAAGPTWTDWLLDEMRQVRGEGRFGVVEALDPADAAELSIKNGWTLHYDDGLWRVNCLAIHPDWVLAVMTTYPEVLGLSYGASICAAVTQQVVRNGA